MTDRELTEAAAKAVGLWDEVNGCIDIPWNPLADDGDALRLAVKLRLNVSFTRGLGAAHTQEFMQVAPASLGHLAEFGPIGTDASATIRRAIVCAASAVYRDSQGGEKA